MMFSKISNGLLATLISSASLSSPGQFRGFPALFARGADGDAGVTP
jgi:hypothetical protein